MAESPDTLTVRDRHALQTTSRIVIKRSKRDAAFIGVANLVNWNVRLINLNSRHS